jgi:choline-sulfatase
MTAQHSYKNRIFINKEELPSDSPTIAHGLGAAGYESVLCGKIHFQGPDQYHGFERRLLEHANSILHSMHVYRRPGGDRRHARISGMSDYSVKVAGYGRQAFQYYDHIVTEEVCSYIAERRQEDRPYCLVAGYLLPHDPYIAEKELFDYYMNVLPQQNFQQMKRWS